MTSSFTTATTRSTTPANAGGQHTGDESANSCAHTDLLLPFNERRDSSLWKALWCITHAELPWCFHLEAVQQFIFGIHRIGTTNVIHVCIGKLLNFSDFIFQKHDPSSVRALRSTRSVGSQPIDDIEAAAIRIPLTAHIHAQTPCNHILRNPWLAFFGNEAQVTASLAIRIFRIVLRERMNFLTHQPIVFEDLLRCPSLLQRNASRPP